MKKILTGDDWVFMGDDESLTRDPDADERAIAPVWRMTVMMVGVVVAGFIIWATFSPIDEVSKASGAVIPSSHVQAIQHLEGGIVRAILVEDGQIVKKGQPLIMFDDTSAKSDLGQMQARQKSLAMQAARLRAFADGEATDTALSEDEEEILSSMQDARENQQSVLRDQIAQREKELDVLKSSRRTAEKNITLLRKQTAIHEEMAAKGVVAQLTAMGSRRELNQATGQLEELRSQEKRALNAIDEARGRLQSLESDLRQDAMKNLGAIEAELSEVNQAISKLESADARTVVTAPVRGIVKGLNIHTQGAVAESGKLLMEIVPLDQELIVEASVSPADIGNLRVGQPAKVKVSAYDFARYGSLKGYLKSVSASTFQNDKGESFYKMKIGLDRAYVGNDPSRNAVLPGMTVQADIVTGKKTVLQYLLKPMKTVAGNAFYER
jgi:adhesin transport system membrane fusion protein